MEKKSNRKTSGRLRLILSDDSVPENVCINIGELRMGDNNENKMTCIECKYFSMKMVCYGNEPFEVCECLKNIDDINENTEICDDFELNGE